MSVILAVIALGVWDTDVIVYPAQTARAAHRYGRGGDGSRSCARFCPVAGTVSQKAREPTLTSPLKQANNSIRGSKPIVSGRPEPYSGCHAGWLIAHASSAGCHHG
jgi:hypothetical protein